MSDNPAHRIKGYDSYPIAILIWVVCVAIAFKFQMLTLYDFSPYVVLNGDTSNVVSFVAGWLYPERFSADLMLGVPERTGSYVTLVLPLLAAMHFLVGDLGLTAAYLMFPIVLVQLLGFYRLGRAIGCIPGIALGLAVASLVPIQTLPGDFWGIEQTPLVRCVYGAIFPWLLVIAMRCGEEKKALYWFIGLAAFAQYVHGVSGVGVTPAILLGLLALKPEQETFAQWFVRIVLAGLAFVVAIVPFAWIYLGAFPTSSDDAVVARTLVEWGPYGSVELAIAHLLDRANSLGLNWRGYGLFYLVGLIGLVGCAVSGTRQAKNALFFLLVLVGLLITALVIPYLDQQINAALGKLPWQIDLVRNTRYLIPVLLIGLALISQSLWDIAKKYIQARGIGILMALFLVATFARFYHPFVYNTLPGMWDLRFNDGADYAQRLLPDGLEPVLGTLQSMPVGQKVFPLTADHVALSVRYGALQPVVWTVKDRNLLLYSSMSDLAWWEQVRALVDDLQAGHDVSTVRDHLCAIITLAPHDVLLVDRSWVSSAALDVLQQLPVVTESADVSLIKPEADMCAS